MADPIRSDVLAAMLQRIFGGSGEAYSIPVAEGVGVTVTGNNPTPHSLEHEGFHIDAGRNDYRNGPYGSVDTAEFLPPVAPRIPVALSVAQKPSPMAAAAMMAADDERRIALARMIQTRMNDGQSVANATRAAYNLMLRGK